MLHEVYDKAGKPRPTSWTQLPPANASQFAYREVPDPANPAVKTYVYDPDNSGVMVPPPTAAFLDQVGGPQASPFFRFNKTARGLANLMRNLTTTLRSARVVSQLTLGAYGSLIEFTVHNWMHMRWATALPRDPATGQPIGRDGYDIDRKWDVPENDYLGDFHSSHVNPIFWKLHGWVDGCIGVWQAAHDATHPGQVRTQEVRGIPWFATGPWVLKADPFDWPGADGSHGHGHGGGHGGHGGHAGDEEKTLEQVIVLLKEIAERPEATEAVGRPRAARRLSGFARFSVLEQENE